MTSRELPSTQYFQEEDWYKVAYDDGDQEDLTSEESVFFELDCIKKVRAGYTPSEVAFGNKERGRPLDVFPSKKGDPLPPYAFKLQS